AFVGDAAAADGDAFAFVGTAVGVEAARAGREDLAGGEIMDRRGAVDVDAVAIAVVGRAEGAGLIVDVAGARVVAGEEAVVVDREFGGIGLGGVETDAGAVAADDGAADLVGDGEVGAEHAGLHAVTRTGDAAVVVEAGVGRADGAGRILEGEA